MLQQQNIFNSDELLVNKGENNPSPSYSPYLDQKADELKRLQITSYNPFLNHQRNYLRYQLKKWGENPTILTQIADVHLLKHEYVTAINIYTKVIRLDKYFLQAYEKNIFALLATKRISDANDLYIKYLEITNKRLDILHNYVLFRVIFYNQNKEIVDKGLNDLKYILEKDPKNFEVINTYGFILLNFKSNILDARKYFIKAQSLNNHYIHAINNLGVTYLRQKKIIKAKPFFNEVIKIDKNYPSAYENLASSYLSEKKPDVALKVLQEAWNKNVSLSEVWQHNYAWLSLENNNIEDAQKWYIKRIVIEPKNDLIYNNLGNCYLKLGDKKEAKKCYQKAIAIVRDKLKQKTPLDTRSLNAFYNLGRMVMASDLKLLSEISDEILRMRANDLFGIFFRGHVYLMEKKYDLALIDFKDVYKRNLKIQEFYTDYSYLLETGPQNYTEAIKVLNKAVKDNIVNDLIYNNLAFAYVEKGEFINANKALAKAANKNDPSIMTTKAVLYIRKGNKDSAEILFHKALKKFEERKDLVNIKLVKQIKFYEEARYSFTFEKDKSKARELILKASEYGESAMSKNIEKLIMKLK